MAEITTTQAFSDGDTVTATKLNNITANAAIQTEAITNRSAETTVDQANDLLLMYDASATALKKISLSNVIKAGTASNFPVTGNATVGGTFGVTGASTLSSTLGVSDTISATKASGTGLAVTNNATIGGTLGVTGASTLSSTLGVSDTISATKSTGTGLAVTSNATVGGTLAVTGAITASSTVNGTTIPTSKTLVTIDDTQTLTGKTVNLSSNTLAGTLAQFNTSCSDADFASLDGSETLSNKTLTSPAINTGTISGGTINNAVIGGTTAAAGSFTTLSATSPITTQAGTAAAPAIVPTGDTNTGIFFPASDTIAFSEGGTESMRIDSSGNVGIGTSPSSLLHISSSSAGSSVLRIENTSGTFETTSSLMEILFRAKRSITTNDRAKISVGRGGAGGSDADAFMSFHTSDTGATLIERLRIDSSGNVGIGTTSPQNILHISSSGPVIRIQDNDTVGNGTNSIATWFSFRDSAGSQTGYFGFPSDPNFYIWNQTNSAMVFGTNNTERLRITSGGNVGIGTTNPSSLFHVNGVITHSAGTIGSNANGTRTIQSGGSPSGGSNGDIYYIY